MARLAKLRRVGRGEPLGAAWRVVWLVLYWPVSLFAKVSYRNLDLVPQTGPAILVANHISHVDPFYVAKMVLDAGRVPRILAKESIFAVPLVGTAMRAMGHIPVRRNTVDAALALAPAVQALKDGKIIVLHPEGTVTRDPDGWPMSGRTGAARLALLAPDVPVVPVAQWGIQNSIDLYGKRIKLFPRPQHLLAVGKPIDLSEFREGKLTARTLHAVTDVIVRTLRDEVAEVRGIPAPSGELYRWRRRDAKGAGDAG